MFTYFNRNNDQDYNKCYVEFNRIGGSTFRATLTLNNFNCCWHTANNNDGIEPFEKLSPKAETTTTFTFQAKSYAHAAHVAKEKVSHYLKTLAKLTMDVHNIMVKLICDDSFDAWYHNYKRLHEETNPETHMSKIQINPQISLNFDMRPNKGQFHSLVAKIDPENNGDAITFVMHPVRYNKETGKYNNCNRSEEDTMLANIIEARDYVCGDIARLS